ncbi:MAG: apolipoprotein N-acyltransferase [Deltaproteobacteria bacterium]|nr:apolipoprotein N-acyltransferase [Deltaproteobacteria bacterium]
MIAKYTQEGRIPSLLKIAGSITLALLTSFLLVFSFPNPDQGWLAWIALVPLILACHNQRPLSAFLLGLLSGMVTLWGICGWLFGVSAFHIYHALPIAVYFGLFPALWCLAFPLLRLNGIALIILAPSLWVALDYVKTHAGFMAFPWVLLAHSQHSNLAVLQIAAFTGEYGVTFLVVMASAALAVAVIQKKWQGVAAAALIIAVIHGWGFIILSDTSHSEQLKVAVVQPSILRSERETPDGMTASFDRLKRLTLTAAASEPELVVWPETAVRDLGKDAQLFAQVKAISQSINAPILTGASESIKFSRKSDSQYNILSLEQYQYNSAYFITPEESLVAAPYRKRILVPFGEYMPLDSFIPWPSWFVPESSNVLPGDGYKHYALAGGVRASPIICWENLFTDYVRLLARKDTQVIVQLVNDNWFGRTAAARQHNLASVLRAVENRVPVVIASNTGPSQIIDAFGRICDSIPQLFTAGVAMAEVPVAYRATFYTAHGEVFVFMSFSILAAFIIVRVIFKGSSVKSLMCCLRGINLKKEGRI